MAHELTILILTNDAGLGHRRAAEATVRALEAKYGSACKVRLANPLDDPSMPEILRNLQLDYNHMVRSTPSLYSLGHTIGNTSVANKIMEMAQTRVLEEPLAAIFAECEPAVIVATHPAFVYALVHYREAYRATWSICVLVTDLAQMQRLWFRAEADLYLVPTRDAAERAVDHGVSPERIHVTGIPVSPALATERADKHRLQAELNLVPDLPVVLFVGSRRLNDAEHFLAALDAPSPPRQLLIVTGDDAELYEHLQGRQWRVPVQVHGFVKEFARFLLGADIIVGKAGGLTVAEALAAGCPLLIVQCYPKHEQGNADYVVRHGAGIRAETPAELTSAVNLCLAEDRRLLLDMSARSRELGRPHAAIDAADQLWNLASRPPSPTASAASVSPGS